MNDVRDNLAIKIFSAIKNLLSSWHRSFARWLGVILCIVVISWLALGYFVPSPPSRITIATAFKGSTFDYFGQRYRERFARAGVKVDLHETAGVLENIRLLQDPNSGVDVAFVTGGVSDSSHAPESALQQGLKEVELDTQPSESLARLILILNRRAYYLSQVTPRSMLSIKVRSRSC